MKAFQPGIFDAVITDPPYASGGTKQNERNRTTNQKYSSMKAENALPDFDGDNKDQRSWTHWMAEWLYDARKACKVGAPICLFIDWRQYPSITDALQWAGWIWRGTAVWDKGNSRPQKGRFRQQAEYIVWGSNGPMPINRPVSCLPGVFRYRNPQNRIHVTEKPLQLMKDVIAPILFSGEWRDERVNALSGDEKIRAYSLSLKIYQSTGDIEISAEEALMIKEAALVLSPGGYAQIVKLIDG